MLRRHTRWAQPSGDGDSREMNYPAKAWAAGCEACHEAGGYPGDDVAIFQMDWKSVQHEGQWQLLYLLGGREQLAMYHPSGFNTFNVLPNIAPMYVQRQLSMFPRNLSAWEATAATLKARQPGPPRSHSGRYSWYEFCPPTVWPDSPSGMSGAAQERDCLTNAMLFKELADAFGWDCFQRAFEYYAHNLTQHTKVGNNDEKADNYWYWFMSVATQRDLTPFFNDNSSWAYGVSANFHGTNFVPTLGLKPWGGRKGEQGGGCTPLPAFEVCPAP